MKLLTFTLSIFVLSMFTTPATAQVNQKCATVDSNSDVSFTILNANDSSDVQNSIVGNILLKSKFYSRIDLEKVVRLIRARYCGKGSIAFSFFEKKSDAVGWHFDFVTSKGAVDRRRAEYYFDTETGKEYILYSSKRGNPVTENRIELSF